MAKPNWKDKTIWTADNLHVMRGMNSESIDLIYLDPPFNSKRNYAAPIGSKAAGAEFKDTWTLDDVDVEWVNLIGQKHPALHRVLLAAMTNSDKSYLAYMAVRILEMRRILKSTGSIYLHCDPTMSHYLKLVMDAIFGKKNFRNEIVWCYSGGGVPRKDFPRKHDVILRYGKSERLVFNAERKPYKENTQAVGKHSTLSGGADIDLERGTPVTDWWSDIKTVTGWSPENEFYPTQKPLALLERIIKSSSDSSPPPPPDYFRPLLRVCYHAGGGRLFATAMGWRGCIEESGRAGGQAHQKGTGAIPVYHSSHGHTAEDGLGTPATVQSSHKQNEVIRRTGRTLRRLQTSLPKTATGSRPYHCAEQGGNRSPQKSATAMHPMQ